MRIFFTLLLFFISSFAFSQAHTYKFKLGGVDDANELKTARQKLTQIFDVSPDYNEFTEYFTVKSETDINFETLNAKLASMGYEIVFFLKDEEGSQPNNHPEED